MHSEPARDAVFEDYAGRIARHLPLHGAWFFQLKKDCQGAYKLLEIAPRIAGTSGLYRGMGINFALLSLYEQERIPISLLSNDMQIDIDRSLINRYRHNCTYTAVYVDFDDTLVLNGKVNTELVRFLYQCVNAHIRIVLITKHAEDIHKTLERYRLSGLFDDVIHLDKLGAKSDYIRERDAILIDDSFSERKAAHERLGILTFDCSMLDVLIDDRM